MSNLHHKNKNNSSYDMEALSAKTPALKEFIFKNKYGNLSIDFSKPKAIKLLNQAILALDYGIENWDFPAENLCPPIPGRADYIHHLAELIGSGKKKILDVGCGATIVYPILGVVEYGWEFVGSDISESSLKNAQQIIQANEALKGKIKLKLQKNKHAYFEGIIENSENFDAVMCNPPFHKSMEEALAKTKQKVSNLNKSEDVPFTRNFSGQAEELSYPGGEYNFVNSMIYKSKAYAQRVGWFTSLVSKKENLNGLYVQLGKMNVADHKVIDMGTGNKKSRILAWKF